jgi:hypothetical protein
MSFFEKFFAGVFGLVLVYLLVRNWRGVNGILSGFAGFNTQLITALQGNTTGVGVTFNAGGI